MSKGRISGLLIVLLGAIITLAAVAVSTQLRNSEERSRYAGTSIQRMEVLAHHLTALEWQAIGERGLSSELEEEALNARDEMSELLGDLEKLDPNNAHLHSIRHVYEVYNSAVVEEFGLLKAGNFDQAKLVDDEQVDPGFITLNQALITASAGYEEQGSRIDQVASIGTVVVPFLAAFGIGLLFWLFQKAQTASRVAGIEKGALARNQQAFQLLNEMGNWLQASHSNVEAYGVIASFGQRLFPDETGVLYIFNSSRNFVEEVTTWGTDPAQTSKSVFQPDECWALRLGQKYMVADTKNRAVLCQHVGQPAPDAYLCVPLVAQGQTLGVLHLRYAKPLAEADAQATKNPLESKLQLAITVSEHVALALTNIGLKASLREQATRDPLTGLYNRRYMEEFLGRELARAARRIVPVGLVMIDIDHFKNFNDTFGHAAGDKVLIELGSLLRAQFRQEDIACRYGGEEFVLVLPESSYEDTCRRVEELRDDVQHMSFQYHGQTLGAITLSLGAANFPEHGKTIESLLASADSALYSAKAQGRNRLVVTQVNSEGSGVVS